MSVAIETPSPGAALTVADGCPVDGGLAITVRGTAPRRAPIFVNDEVLEADPEGRFEVVCVLPPGEVELVAGPLTGCACVQSRVVVTVAL